MRHYLRMPESRVMARGLSSMTQWTMNASKGLRAEMETLQDPLCVVKTDGLISLLVTVRTVFSDVRFFKVNKISNNSQNVSFLPDLTDLECFLRNNG